MAKSVKVDLRGVAFDDPRLSAEHYIRLFSDPAFLLERFTTMQLESGFWAMYPDPARVESVVFEVLQEILSLPSHACQMATLHGLGHLHHARTAEVVEAYLSANPSLDESARKYARAASAGRVQ